MKVICKRCKSEYESSTPLPDGTCETCPNCEVIDKIPDDLRKFIDG